MIAPDENLSKAKTAKNDEFCFALTSVTIPDSVTTIGDRAFSNCTSLTDVYFKGTEEEWESISVSNVYIDSFLSATVHFLSEDYVD